MSADADAGQTRQDRQRARRRAIADAVMAEGSIRIEGLAERFDISLMTVHRDLDDLERSGLLRKTRGVASALPTQSFEASDLYRSAQQWAEKEALAQAALRFIDPGQAIVLDDSTTVGHVAGHLAGKAPLTVISNALTVMNQLGREGGIHLVALGGEYRSWCSAFLGRVTIRMLANLRTDTFLMSAPAVSDDMTFHQSPEVADIKRAMFETAARRILLVDHTKFGKRALHAVLPLAGFDIVVLDDETPMVDRERLERLGVEVVSVIPLNASAGLTRSPSDPKIRKTC